MSNSFAVMASSARWGTGTDVWPTPQTFFDTINAEFSFTLDVCALQENTKCTEFYSPEQNGLTQEWRGTCWCNPPYSQLREWITKARQEAEKGATVVMLIPARTDTRAWHEHIFGNPNVEVRFIKGRIVYQKRTPSPFPSAVIIFRPGKGLDIQPHGVSQPTQEIRPARRYFSGPLQCAIDFDDRPN